MEDIAHLQSPEHREQRVREESAVVLDFLPHGYPFDNRPSHKKTPIVQAIGKEHFALLELVPKKDVFLQPLQEVYIGEGKRDQIHHIIGRLPLERLTATAKSELDLVLKDLIHNSEKRFVDFFNKSQPLTTRMHQLELLPGLGKKHMWEIIEKREEKPFSTFQDIKDRVKLMPDPEKAIMKRILAELSGKEKHRVFVDA
jgi:putative nucleotide binding protein